MRMARGPQCSIEEPVASPAVLAALAVLSVLVSACEPETPKEAAARVEQTSEQAKLVAVVEGCNLYRVNDADIGNYFYFARCPEGAESTFYEYTTGGKHHTTHRVQTVRG